MGRLDAGCWMLAMGGGTDGEEDGFDHVCQLLMVSCQLSHVSVVALVNWLGEFAGFDFRRGFAAAGSHGSSAIENQKNSNTTRVGGIVYSERGKKQRRFLFFSYG